MKYEIFALIVVGLIAAGCTTAPVASPAPLAQQTEEQALTEFLKSPEQTEKRLTVLEKEVSELKGYIETMFDGQADRLTAVEAGGSSK